MSLIQRISSNKPDDIESNREFDNIVNTLNNVDSGLLPLTSPTITNLTVTGTISSPGAKLDLLGSGTASSSSVISFTSLAGASYSVYKAVALNVVPVTNAVDLIVRLSTGSGFLSANYRFQTLTFTSGGSGISGSTGTNAWRVSPADTLGTGANQTYCCEVTIYNVGTSSPLKYMNFQGNGLVSAATYDSTFGGGELDSNSAVVDGVEFLMSSGSIASGTFYLYGARSS